MRIVYIHQYFKTPKDAGGTRSYEMARRLVAAGHEVNMISSRPKEELVDGGVDEVSGIKVHWIGVDYNNKMGFISRVKSFFLFAILSSLKAIRLRADVVFATSTPLTVAVPGVIASFFKRVPLVFEVRDQWPRIPIAMGVLRNPILIFLANILERFTYWYSSHIVALSPGMADGIASRGVSRRKITVIPNGCDLELFSNESIRGGEFRKKNPHIPDGPIVLYPGTIGKVNGVGYLAELAAATIRIEKNINFVVVGDGIELDEVVELSNTLGVNGVNFFVLPPLPKDELVYALRDSSIIVSLIIDVPELEDNSANKFFDALAASRPIAINYGGWQKEIIKRERVGLVISRDVEQAAREVVEFLSDDRLVKASGERAKSLAESMYNRDVLAMNLEKIFVETAV
ncbi:glycosyltransferase family 4 protein [Metapseudomonas resinovorans]|uniref:Glycosyltransferase n=1 Tax=Metapseudomonas resinovorans NBRC 106553 TaxID=1245471 RepID=S6AHH3_METRE|nr:glycosyltransferase family 4 protein [Pseudomonas resinovorans]BAN47715.1 hypothetical protein PCA10_19830 [Pseudomonas resinovorans NBRC 106553]